MVTLQFPALVKQLYFPLNLPWWQAQIRVLAATLVILSKLVPVLLDIENNIGQGFRDR